MNPAETSPDQAPAADPVSADDAVARIAALEPERRAAAPRVGPDPFAQAAANGEALPPMSTDEVRRLSQEDKAKAVQSHHKMLLKQGKAAIYATLDDALAKGADLRDVVVVLIERGDPFFSPDLAPMLPEGQEVLALGYPRESFVERLDGTVDAADLARYQRQARRRGRSKPPLPPRRPYGPIADALRPRPAADQVWVVCFAWGRATPSLLTLAPRPADAELRADGFDELPLSGVAKAAPANTLPEVTAP